jgi:hypothetical protein
MCLWSEFPVFPLAVLALAENRHGCTHIHTQWAKNRNPEREKGIGLTRAPHWEKI